MFSQSMESLVTALNKNVTIKNGGVVVEGDRGYTGVEIEKGMIARFTTTTDDWFIGISAVTTIDEDANALAIQLKVDAVTSQLGRLLAVDTLSRVPVDVLVDYARIKREAIFYYLGETETFASAILAQKLSAESTHVKE